ncbi:MAG TPA: ISKra4 family transposase [Streptosporangiaceae bacterium]|nr:ISKra4 family transposase [Streptosporangiaceae bacterium]
MPPIAEPMIAQAQQQFQELVAYVTGPQTRGSTAYEVELALFRRLLALGAALLRLFFVSRAAEPPAGPVTGPDGTPLAYHDRRGTTYYAVFGKLAFRRHAYTAPGQPVVCPLDAALSLPPRCYSDLLREWMSYGATDEAYRETRTLLERILGLPLSVQALETTVAEDAVDVVAYYDQPPDPAAPTGAGTILVAQADGKGVPLVPAQPVPRPARRGKGHPPATKEAVVTALYTIAPYHRTPADVVAALLREGEHPEPPARPRPSAKEVRATLDGKGVALTRLAARAAQREHPAIQHRVALTDGAEALQQQMAAHLPGYTLVLDIIHASEYLWDAANALLGERHPQRTAWMRRHLTPLLAGQGATVIAALEQAAADPALPAAPRQALLRAAGYYRRNLPHMRYDAYLARGWPIGTGVVEGACGHLVKDRMQQAGMRWTQGGAQAVLDLRAVRLNEDWDAYWRFHRQQQHRRLYGPAIPPPAPVEDQALDLAA